MRRSYIVQPAPHFPQQLRSLEAPVCVVMGEGVPLDEDLAEALADPIQNGDADVSVAARSSVPWHERPLAALGRLVTELPFNDLMSGAYAFRTELARAELLDDDIELETQMLVKLSAQRYRFAPVEAPTAWRRPAKLLATQTKTLLRYATSHNDADNAHDGYNTLSRMEAGAPNYNAWLGRKFRQWAGARVLEVGAGIGTITAELARDREKVVALEVDPFYVRRLKNRFRSMPNVEPHLSDIALADLPSLRLQKLDTVVISNVLEHIEDDSEAIRRFAKVLTPRGRLLIFVPALPALFGSLDQAVGHHRRYTRQTLENVIRQNGFDLEHLEWMNVVGIPGWFVNGRLLGRRAVPPLQLRMYDAVAPLLARAEERFRLPVGMSLFAVARVSARTARG